MAKKDTLFKIIGLAIAIGMMMPILLYWFFCLRVPTMNPEQARRLMTESFKDVLLIDVRPKEAYARFSLKDAVNIPLADIQSNHLTQWQPILGQKKYLLLICNMGYLSAEATNALRGLGYDNTFSIKGGMDAWLAGGKRGSKREMTAVRTEDGERSGIRPITFSLLEQTVICVSAFGLKPIYEIISLIVAFMLWKNKEPDLAALRRGMIAFFLGENACAVNYLFFNEQSILFEFLHIYGMLVGFGLVWYAAMKALDIRVLHYSDRKIKCALLPLCSRCYKYEAISCNYRLLFQFAILATAILALLPLSADLGSFFYLGKIFGDDVVFGHAFYQQILELRLYPAVALICCVISFIILLRGKEEGIENSKIIYATGLGALSFSLMRFLVFQGFSDNPLWAEAWEELTEFLFIAFVCWIIIRVKKTELLSQARSRT